MKTQSRDTSIDAEKVQVALLRNLSVAKRMALVRRLTSSTRRMAKAAIKECNPGKDEKELNLIFAEVLYGKKIADELKKHYSTR